jgi:phenylacetate-CoA ligase
MKKSFAIPRDFHDPVKLLTRLKKEPESGWIKRGERRALSLFRLMSQRVPAYKDFLKKKKINPEKIKTINDFKSVPTIDKDSYLRTYPLKALCWDGKLAQKRLAFSSTSGSTGQPYYFPREIDQDWQYAICAEAYLRENFEIHKRSTLYVNGFALGVWIGGLFTYQAIRLLAERGNYQLSIINPGIIKKDIVAAVKNIGHHFDQIIIGGYPPFIKDAIDDGLASGLDWKKYQLGFIFSAEAFTEKFRDYIIRKAGLKNAYKDTLNHYGTVDLGTMSHETPLSVLLRRLGVKNKKLYQALFSQVQKQPTLTQFVPELFYFEVEGDDLICSAASGLPLVRYDLKDRGGIFTLSEINRKFTALGFNILEKAKEAGIQKTIWNLPFVYVYERRDLSTTLYGLNVYPETVRGALQNRKVEKAVTGKFTMLTKFDQNLDQYLEINVELKAKIKPTARLKKLVTLLIVDKLRLENSEYRKLYQEIPGRALPKIVFWPYEDSLYFRSGGKQKWVIKNKGKDKGKK